MKYAQPPKKGTHSATLAPTLWLMLACSGLFIVTAYATSPGWWSGTGAVNTMLPTNNYAVVNQGQVKQFVARTVTYMNTNGGAGSDLNTLVNNWTNDYYTNGYNAMNREPSDYKAMNVGQLKYIANLVWGRLIEIGYTNAAPTWITTNYTDYTAATVGQLKTIFDFDLTSYSAAPHINSPMTASGAVGTAFSYTFTGDQNPSSMNVSGLPPDLTVAYVTTMGVVSAVVSGTPDEPFTVRLTASASNGSGTGYGAVTITIVPPAPLITSSTNESLTTGLSFEYTITADHDPVSFGATGLPTGLNLNTVTGVISGVPTTANMYTVALSASNAGGTGTTNLTLNVSNPSAPVITSGTPGEGAVNQGFYYAITADNDPVSFSATGLPAGLSLDTTTGVISGTPTTATTGTSVTLHATNAGGTGNATRTFTINAAGIPVLPSGMRAYIFDSYAFTYTVTASNTPTNFGHTGLPSGLTISTGGVISGSVTSAMTTTATISASNSAGTGHAPLELIANISAPTTITSSSILTALTGSPFYYTITGNNNPTSFTATPLPAGLNFNTTTGVIVGTPTAVGVYTVHLGASNANPASPATADLILTVQNPTRVPVITSAKKVSGASGLPFSYTITTSSLTGATYSTSTRPAWLNLDSGTGVLSGTPSSVANYTLTLNATNNAGTGHADLVINILSSLAPVITNAPTASGIAGTAFNYTWSATASPTFSAIGLPGGLSINSSTGAITGTATVGTSGVTLNATNAFGTAISNVIITIYPPLPVIVSSGTASGAFGVPFTPYTILANNNPTGSISLNRPPFSATGLPAGLILNNYSGLIQGTPRTSGTFTATLTASNEGGSGTKNVIFTIDSRNPSLLLTSQSIASGGLASLMIKTDGTVLAVGDNSFGQLGTGNNSNSSSFVPVSTTTSMTGIVGVAGGAITSMALDSSGHIWTWGGNNEGELGNGTDGGGTSSQDSNVPGKVITSSGGPALGNIIAISGGTYFGAALDTNQNVWMWGNGADGLLGNGGGFSIATQDYPGKVVTATTPSTIYLNHIVAISAGEAHMLALKDDGTVCAWGDDTYDELGDGIGMSSDKAISIPTSDDFSNMTAVAAGEFYSLALRNDGTVWAWGYNADGELGNGDIGSPMDEPAPVKNLSDVVAISCGSDHTLALKSDGTVWVWGSNGLGGLADATDDDYSSVPVQIPHLTGVIVIAAGKYQNIVLKSDGSIWAWGASAPEPFQLDNRNKAALPIISSTGTSPKTVTLALPPTISTGDIYYTWDGTEPTSTTTSTKYTAPFSLNIGARINAAIFLNGVRISPVASSQITISGSVAPQAANNVSATASSSSQINVSWTFSDPEANYNTINIYRSDGSGYYLIATVPSSASSYMDTSVVSGISYSYRIKTFNSFDESSATDLAMPIYSSTPATLNIHITAPSGTTPL